MDPAQRQPVANQGLIGDGRGWALVGHDGGITRMHIPALGLLPERVAPETGRFAGRFPHPATHVAVISTGTALANAVG